MLIHHIALHSSQTSPELFTRKTLLFKNITYIMSMTVQSVYSLSDESLENIESIYCLFYECARSFCTGFLFNEECSLSYLSQSKFKVVLNCPLPVDRWRLNICMEKIPSTARFLQSLGAEMNRKQSKSRSTSDF